MFVAAQFTGLEGKYVKIEDTVRSFKAVWALREKEVNRLKRKVGDQRA